MVIIIIIINICELFKPVWTVHFFTEVIESKSSQLSRTLLSILANFNYAVICIVLILPLISNFPSLFFKLLEDRNKVFTNNWHHRRLHVQQLLLLSGKIQVFVYLSAFFYLYTLVCWNSKAHYMISYLHSFSHYWSHYNFFYILLYPWCLTTIVRDQVAKRYSQINELLLVFLPTLTVLFYLFFINSSYFNLIPGVFWRKFHVLIKSTTITHVFHNFRCSRPSLRCLSFIFFSFRMMQMFVGTV